MKTSSAKHNISKSGSFSTYETPDGKINEVKGYLDRSGRWYEVK
ncbi:hypothetical protein [Bacillus wiedmannii]